MRLFGLTITKQERPPQPPAGAEVTTEAAFNTAIDIRKLDSDLAVEYIYSIYLWRAVDMIGSMSSSVPLLVVKEREESQLTRTELDVQELLIRPNPQWTGHALQYWLAVSLAVSNKAFLLRNRGVGGSTQELWPLPVNDVQIIMWPNSRMIKEFRVQFADMRRRDEINASERVFPVDDNGDSDVIYIRRPALNKYTDKSPAAIAAAPAEVFTRVLQRCADIVSNSSNITGLLSTDAEVGRAKVEEIKQKISQFKTGQAQSGGTLVSSNAKWNLTRLSEDPASALSVEIKDSLARDVVMTFGVPTQLVGLPGSDTFNNLAQARVSLLTETILPNYIGLYVAGLNHALMRNGAQIKPDIEHVPSMVAYRHQMTEVAARATMLSINEQRAMLGYPKFEGKNTGSDEADYPDADVPVKLEELRLKRLAIEAQMGKVTNLLGGQPT